MAPLEIRTFPGAGGGVDLASPVHMLADSKARWIVDGLIDKAGLVRQRGKLKTTTQISTKSPYGLMSTFRPDGEFVMAAHVSDDTTGNEFQFLDKNNTGLGVTTYNANYGVPGPPEYFWSSNTLGPPGQVFSFTPAFYWAALVRGMGYWRGGTKADYSTGTITVTQGTAAVTGVGTTWTTNVVPGMFLFADAGGGLFTFLGVVKSVETNTTLTLEDGSLFAAAGKSYLLTSIRRLRPRIGVGRASGGSGQAVINGTGTKFRQIGTGSTWAIFRSRDMQFVGNVSTIQSDTQLTLAANIGTGNELQNDKYVAIKINETEGIVNPLGMPGMISAVWQSRQFYANATLQGGNLRNATLLWYSDTSDLEVLDTTKDGWFLEIPSSEAANMPIIGLCPTESGLLIFKENETYILTGTADPTSWTVRRLTDNGCIAPMGIVAYGGGAIWPSDRGIITYDGTEVKNLTQDSLGDWWAQTFVANQVGAQFYNMVGFVERDHYFLFSEGGTIPTGASFFKGSTEQAFSGGIGFIINLPTEALTFSTNLCFRGSTYISSVGTQKGTTRFLVEKGTDSSSYISSAWPLFIDEASSSVNGGADDFACASSVIGPNFFLETARYDMDDPQLKKLWKQVQMHYRSNGNLTVDVVLNFDTTGTTLGTTLPSSGTMTNKRMKFLKRSQLLGFRVYTIPAGGGSIPTETVIGPWAVGFKRQRPGRV